MDVLLVSNSLSVYTMRQEGQSFEKTLLGQNQLIKIMTE